MTKLFYVWRICELLGILPPGVKPCWHENGAYTQAMLLAYNRIRRE